MENTTVFRLIKGIFGVLLISSCIQITGQNPVQDVVRKEFKISKGQTVLNFPVNNTDRLVTASIRLDGKLIERFTINLAENEPDFWTFFDVTPYQGKKLTVEISNVQMSGLRPSVANDNTAKPTVVNPKALDLVFSGTEFPGIDSLYKEKGRPQVHFSAQRGWINDPNGLLYTEGEYHMYFQHNPYGWQWGNMHWGHAVSRDLIYWKQLNEAIYPVYDESITGRGDAAFSGSAVIDPANTAGFRKNNIDPIIAIYTSTGRGECLKMSYDNGRSFIDYEGNPVLKHNGRDPKVFWYEPGKHWVMVVWDAAMPKTLSLGEVVMLRQHSVYTSPDLKNWTYQSGVEGFFECPELFELPVEGEPGVKKWIMYDAHGRYIVGDFDGKEFEIEQHFTKYENGGGYFYASQTFNDAPDGRRIQVGWGRNITNPGMPFNQAQLFPTELKLRKTLNGYRLCPSPVTEIAKLHRSTQVLNNKVVKPGESALLNVNSDAPLHIIAEFERGDAPISLNILGYELRHDNEWTFVTTDPDEGKGTKEAPAGPFPAPTASTPVTYVPGSEIFKIEAIVDKNILEFFVNDGELYYVTEFNGPKIPKIEALVAGGANPRGGIKKFIVKKLEVHELNSIWIK